ncbi:DUF3578 domain-containing protein [Rossellomorea marisflavi]|uniref:MrcB family domain-containing protein n=1 Tax=Rossellomorea marisflavi TaxID=189381 RepID=UPI0013196BB9|nr:DUF3578 domain-containing protein [Rossellomorea marisflavi]QHA36929.1 DUF3578 domain-containing protein [Rossellomorea marisflavi]
MRKAFEKVLTNYLDQISLPFKPTENEMAKYITREFPELIKHKSRSIEFLFKVQGSVGQGKWTETPWVSIMDRTITNSATKGFYIVYLFKNDMTGVYLSLNQGTTYIKNKYKGNKPRSKMKEVSSILRSSLDYSKEDFPNNEIDLRSTTDNAQNYMAAHICGKYYSLKSLPDDDELFDDLKKMIRVYRRLKITMGRRNTEHFIDYLLNIEAIDDTQFQSDVQLVSPTHTPYVPQPVPLKEQTGERSKWKRDAAIAKEALLNSNYSCEYDQNHKTFKSAVTGENFVEAHHLIPIRFQSDFIWSLDVPGNIVSICPNCHRQIHHASKTERELMIRELYKNKADELNDFGIAVTYESLIKMYE